MTRRVADAPDTPGHPDRAAWEAATWDDGQHVHVVPVTDLVEHAETPDGDCPCGPAVEWVEGDEEHESGWLITHHSLDNREVYE